jgi:hypothetical protein
MRIVGHDGCVAGGAARAVMFDEKPNDIDVFVFDPTVGKRADWQVLRAGRNQRHHFREVMIHKGYALARGDDTSDTFTRADNLDVQFIYNGGAFDVRWENEADVIGSFGFTAEMFALESGPPGSVAQNVVTTRQAVDDVHNKDLRLNHVFDPIRILWRAVKYGQKGYHWADMEECVQTFAVWDGFTKDEQAALYVRATRTDAWNYPEMNAGDLGTFDEN